MDGLWKKIDHIKGKKPGALAKEAVSGIKQSQWIFAGVVVAIAYAAWFLVYLGTYEIYSGFAIWILSAVALLALALGVGLSFFLLYPPKLAYSTYFVISTSAFIFFGWRGIELFAVIVFFLTTCFGYIWVKREQALLIRFAYIRLLRRGMPIFFMGLSFALALFYNTSPIGRVMEIPRIPEQAVSILLVPAEYIISPLFPNFKRDTKIGEIKRAIPGLFTELPDEKQDQTLLQFIHTTINTQLSAVLLPYKQFLAFIYLFGLFLVFRTIGMPMMWLAMGAGWIVVRILLKYKILKFKQVGVKKEELVL